MITTIRPARRLFPLALLLAAATTAGARADEGIKLNVSAKPAGTAELDQSYQTLLKAASKTQAKPPEGGKAGPATGTKGGAAATGQPIAPTTIKNNLESLDKQSGK